jgi:hypothetical protein
MPLEDLNLAQRICVGFVVLAQKICVGIVVLACYRLQNSLWQFFYEIEVFTVHTNTF